MALTSKQRRRMQLNMLMAAASFASTKSNVSPLTIFGASRLKLWLDSSDISTLFQDNTLATPVTALNDPIGGIKDKSGNSNHATQGTSGSRPLWKQDGNGCYNSLFDGTDDSWATAAIDFSGSDKIAVFAAVRKLSDAATGIVAELGNGTGNGTWFLASPRSGGFANMGFWSKGTILADAQSPSSYAAPLTSVISGIGDISAPAATLRINGAQVTNIATSQGTGNYSNAVINIGRRNNASLPFNGQIYQLFIVSGAVTAAEIAAAETFLNSKSRAY